MNAVDALVAERSKAREARDFATADRIRRELLALGYVVRDSRINDHSPLPQPQLAQEWWRDLKWAIAAKANHDRGVCHGCGAVHYPRAFEENLERVA